MTTNDVRVAEQKMQDTLFQRTSQLSDSHISKFAYLLEQIKGYTETHDADSVTSSDRSIDSSSFDPDPFVYQDYLNNIDTDPNSEQKLNEMLRHYEKHITMQCNTNHSHRDKTWYETSYRILQHIDKIRDFYTSHSNLILQGLSFLANCMMNNKSLSIDSNDVLLTLQEVHKRGICFKQRSKLGYNEMAGIFQILLSIESELRNSS